MVLADLSKHQEPGPPWHTARSSCRSDLPAGLTDFDVEAPDADDWAAIAKYLEQYADFALGGTDASLAALADSLGTDLLVTLDERHFRAIRSRATGKAHRILPG